MSVNGSGIAWTLPICAGTFAVVTRTALLRIVGLAIGIVALACGAAESPASDTVDGVAATHPSEPLRTWKHPVDWYGSAVRRWFEDLPPELRYSEARVRHGDDARWARPDWNDDDWIVTGIWDLEARSGVEWVRFRVRMGEDGRMALPPGIMISTVRAYEIYWDGVLLGTSGKPGNSFDEEVAGRVDEWFSIPAALHGPGEHVVAMRTSSHRCGFPAATSGFRFMIDSPAVLQGKVLREAFVPTLAAGALFMTGMATLILWMLAARRTTLLLLCGICLSGATMQALQAIRWFFQYPADWHYPVLSAMTALVGAQGFLIVAFVVVLFEVPRRRWLLAVLAVVLMAVAWTSPERLNLGGVRILAVGIAAAFACSAWAVFRAKRGAWPVLIGVATSALLMTFQSEDYRASFFLKFAPALVGLIAALALQLNDERRQARAAQLAAARLEAELLKKNLQPHFLLNTLAVLTEIVEQDPGNAVKLINDLADEFRSLSRMSAEKLIPLAHELELCRAHLRVMSVRTGRRWSMDSTGVDETAPVPPALFLTLIENGFAHQKAEDGAVFRLKPTGEPDGVGFSFVSPGKTRDTQGRPAGGTGLRYVKARLEESFPGGWTFDQGAVDDGWQTVIRWKPDLREGGRS